MKLAGVVLTVAASLGVALAACGGDAAPSALRVSPATLALEVGATGEVGAYYVVEGSSERASDPVAWTSSDPGVATVTATSEGRASVTGVAIGTSTLTAAAGGFTAAATVEVGTALPAPTVTATAPADGATAVPRPVDLEITFSRAMRADTLVAQTSGGPCSGSLQLSRDDFTTCEGFAGPPVLSAGDTTASLVPTPGLPGSTTFKVRVTTAATGGDGVALATAYTHATGFTTAVAEPCATGLVISQVFGGGGVSGSPYNNDFVELHNAGLSAVSLSGLSIQYAGSGGTGAWGAQALPAVSVPAGGYFLVAESSTGGSGVALPTPDFVPGNSSNLGTNAGKVALVSSITALDGICPTAGVIDLVGYGGANCYEGGASAPSASSLAAVQRRNLGCVDAGENSTDFVAAGPAPRNGATAPAACVCFARRP